MIAKKYLKRIQSIAIETLGESSKVFIFGSSLDKDTFADIDIGVMDLADEKHLRRAEEAFEESTLPYKIDLVDFDKVDEKFKKEVFNTKIKWLT